MWVKMSKLGWRITLVRKSPAARAGLNYASQLNPRLRNIKNIEAGHLLLVIAGGPGSPLEIAAVVCDQR